MRPALEAAIGVARAGELEQPPIPSPTKLLPYLEFSKYPQAALDVARKVMDDDPAFRARVLEHADLEQLGTAADLFLRRPDGWEAALAELERSASSQAQSARAEREERRATKQLQITREMLDEAKRTADSADAELVRLREEVDIERAVRGRLEARLDDLETAAVQARDERANAVRELKAMESRLADRTTELRESNRRVAALQEELSAEQAKRAEAERALDRPVPEPEPVPEPRSAGPDAPTEPALDRAVLAAAIAEASGAAAQLAAALDRAAREVRPPATAEPEPGPVGDRGIRAPRRRSIRLPIGIFDDSVEAAEALVSTPGMLLLVDGYNVTLSGWPDLPLVFQRERLIDALAAIQARTGVGVVIVFDGADAGRDLPPESRLRGIQVRFTEPGVEADDVIIEAVRAVPMERPVTVVSSDHRVRDGTAAGGANLLYSQQLLDLIRRG